MKRPASLGKTNILWLRIVTKQKKELCTEHRSIFSHAQI
jgi:hypothetical protein